MLFSLYQLTFHENMFYATREVGRLYETGRHLHNYALTYALGLAKTPYFHAQQIPAYADELSVLNQSGIYVTPARGVNVHYQMVTFKFADNYYRMNSQTSRRNLPSFGRAKEVAVGSVFEFGIIHPEGLKVPRWVRMGLWGSKALLESLGETELKPVAEKVQISSLPLNPLDVQGEFQVFDLISMPPSSLVENARLKTSWLKAEISERQHICLPANMAYRFQ